MPVTINGTTGLGGDTGYLRSGTLDAENRIINGAFDFWQRGTSFTATGYGADRWLNDFVGGTCSSTRQAFTVGDTLGSNNPTFFHRISASGQTLPAHYATVVQPIEGVRSYAGQTITVLGWARRASGSGNMAISYAQAFGTGGTGLPPNVFGFGGTVSLTGVWAPFAVTMVLPTVAGKTLGTNNNDFMQVAFWASAGSDRNSITGSLGLQTIAIDLWGIHIRQGTHTTAAVDLYRQPELQQELARCQRYYSKSYVLSVNPGSITYFGASVTRVVTTVSETPIFLPVEMRRAPTVTVYNPETGGTGTVRNGSRATNDPASAQFFSTRIGNVSATGHTAAADAISFHWVADAEL